MSPCEQELIIQCQKGDLSQFGELYNLYIKRIYSYVYYRVHHKETAEDITSKVFMRAMEKISHFNSEKGSFSSWLYKIAKNAICDHFKQQKPVENIDDIWGLGTESNMTRDIDTKNKLEEVQKYLKTLKPEQREIIIMRLWDELPYKEISEILQKSEGSIKVAFLRAIEKLRDSQTLILFILLIIKSKIHG